MKKILFFVLFLMSLSCALAQKTFKNSNGENCYVMYNDTDIVLSSVYMIHLVTPSASAEETSILISLESASRDSKVALAELWILQGKRVEVVQMPKLAVLHHQGSCDKELY